MQALQDLFALYAELSIALAGFSGVSSAFAGRERVFRPVERTRLQAVLLSSSSVLAGCLAFYSATSFAWGEARSLAVAAAASLALTAPLLVFVLPSGWRHHKDPDSTTEPWVLYVSALVCLTLVGIYALVLAQQGGPPLLVTAFSIQLLFGLWMFVRLLTRPN